MARLSFFRATLNLFIAIILINTLLNISPLTSQTKEIEASDNNGDVDRARSSNGTEQTQNLNILNTNLDVLYLVPQNLDDIFLLNEKDTFGENYVKGWILPSEEKITLSLYLYYEGLDERRLNLFFNQALDKLLNEQFSVNKQNTMVTSTLYMFFTPKPDCSDLLSRNNWPLEIVDHIAPRMYKAKLNNVVLPYSETPLYMCVQQFDTSDSEHDSLTKYYSHQGTDYWLSIITTRSLIPTWARIVFFFVLLCFSGLFSGLNLGLMSLDLSELDILKKIGTPKEQTFAKNIYPLRKRGNFLLCTILLGNVLVNAVSTLLLGDMVSGIYAAFGSTFLIVVFGEIIPQAACSKHGLAVGSYTRYITYLFMIITCPLSFPISKLLDCVLGQEITAAYSREKIKELMKNVQGIGEKEFKIISGALDFNKKKVREVMTKLENVFMLEKNAHLDFETIARIAQEGFSRIPIYENERENVVGLLHVKDFTLLDPDDNMPVEGLLKFYNHKVSFCDAERAIDEMFEEFRKGESHLAFVTEIQPATDTDPIEKIVGIVTLEDILEELVQMEIYDEFDDKKEIEKEEQEEIVKKYNSELLTKFKKMSSSSEGDLKKDLEASSEKEKMFDSQNETEMVEIKLESAMSPQFKKQTSNKKTRYEPQNSHDLTFFLQQQKEGAQRTLITPQIRFVMFQFLITTVKPFTNDFLTKNVVELIFKRAVFKESRRADTKSPSEYLYTFGKGCNYFILIISGEATIEVGREKLEFPAGPFAYFGVNALLCGSETAEQVLQEDISVSSPIKDIDTQSTSSAPEAGKKKITNKQYVPDFSLRVDEKCVYMKIDRDLWRNGVIKSRYELLNNQKSDSIDYFPSGHKSEPDLESSMNSPKNAKSKGSPHVSFFKSLNDTISPFLAKSPSSENNNNLNINKLNSRRSTIAASALAKAQQETTSKRSKTHLDQLVEMSDSQELIKQNMTEAENMVISEETINETEPFLNKKYSTSSQTLENQKIKNSNVGNHENFTTLSQKSYDD